MNIFEKSLIVAIYLFPFVLILGGAFLCWHYKKKRKTVLIVLGISFIVIGTYFGFFKSFGPVLNNR